MYTRNDKLVTNELVFTSYGEAGNINAVLATRYSVLTRKISFTGDQENV